MRCFRKLKNDITLWQGLNFVWPVLIPHSHKAWQQYFEICYAIFCLSVLIKITKIVFLLHLKQGPTPKGESD